MVSLLRLLGALGGVAVTLFVGSFYSSIEASTFFVQYSTILLTAAVLRFGFEDSLLRFVSGGGASFVACGIIAKVVVCAITLLAVIYFFSNFFAGGGYPASADIEYFLIPIYVFLILVSSVLQGLGRYKTAILVNSILFPFFFITLNVVSFFISAPVEITDALVAAVLLSFIVATLVSVPHLLEGRGRKTILTTPAEQGFFYINSMLGVFGIHGVILIADRLLRESDFVEFSLILRMCQMVSVFVVVMNFTFAPKARALFVKRKYEKLCGEYMKTMGIGLLLSFSLTIFIFLISLMGYAEFKIFSVLELNSFWIVWSAFCLNLIFGCVGYLYIMMDNVKISSLVGLSSTVGMMCIFLIKRPSDIESFAIIFASFSVLSRFLLTTKFFYSDRAF